MEGFFVVKFMSEEDGESVEVVPKTWFDTKNDMCFWPPVRSTLKITRFIKKMIQPNENWIKLKAKVLYKTDSYEKARQKLIRAEETSDLYTTDAEASPRKKKRPSQKLPVLPLFPHGNISPLSIINPNSNAHIPTQTQTVHTSVNAPTQTQTVHTSINTPTQTQTAHTSISVPTQTQTAYTRIHGPIPTETAFTNINALTPTQSAYSNIHIPVQTQTAYKHSDTSTHAQRTFYTSLQTPPQISITSTPHTDSPTSTHSEGTHTTSLQTPETFINTPRSHFSRGFSPFYTSPPSETLNTHTTDFAGNSLAENNFAVQQPNLGENSSAGPCSCHEGNKLFQRKVLSILTALKENIQRLEEKFEQTLPQTAGKRLPVDCPDLPVDSAEKLGVFNTYVGKKNTFPVICNHFGCIGGTNVKDLVRRILQNILTNELALHFNWKGTGGKKLSFATHDNVVKMITNAVRQHPSFERATDFEIEDAIKKWLVHAKDRNGGRDKRREENETRNEIN